MAELMKRRAIRVGELREIAWRQFSKRYEGLTREYFDAFYPTKTKLTEWLMIFGVCEYSGEDINGQPFDFDHDTPNAMLYEGDEIHWKILLRKWHVIKTKADVKNIAKAKRMGGETGQYARRKRRNKPLITRPKNYVWASRPMQSSKTPRYSSVKEID